MCEELHAACEAGRAARVTAVERRFDVAHATFSRNYRDLIDWFRSEARHNQTDNSELDVKQPNRTADTLRRLRQENSDLRRVVEIYAAEIQRLTVDNEEMKRAIIDGSKVSRLTTRR
jgi:hypothetical protein